jgi:outer membrane protein assembly factor BamE (lipoprotein component of BamABCDE complex)
MQDNRAIDRRHKLKGAAALMTLAVLVGGCASIKDHRGYLVDRTLIDSVSPGVDNKQSVQKALGEPTFSSQFGQPAWYYVSIDTRQAPFLRPKTTDQTVLKVTFDPAGNVATVERAGMEKVVRLDPNSDATPTLGRNRSFFEDLFGNIGAVGALPGGAQGGGSTGPGPNGS